MHLCRCGLVEEAIRERLLAHEKFSSLNDAGREEPTSFAWRNTDINSPDKRCPVDGWRVQPRELSVYASEVVGTSLLLCKTYFGLLEQSGIRLGEFAQGLNALVIPSEVVEGFCFDMQ